MDCVWDEDVALPRFDRLRGDLRTDVLIVGGGMAGLLCAWELRRAGVDCALVEENRILGGVSGRTTAKLTSQHGLVYSKLVNTLGKEQAKLYYQANEKAVSAMKALAQKADCDFEEKTSFIYQTDGADRLEQEAAAYDALGIPYLWQDSVPLPIPVCAAAGFSRQGQFHPVKLAAHIARGLPIYENTKALAYTGDRVETPYGSIQAEKIIVATHFPLWNKHGAYFLKLYQQRSYVIALENAPQVEGMYLDSAENGLSVRNAGELLLLGGGGHRTGKQGQGWRMPETAAKAWFPQCRETTRWANQDCMTLDGMPYIGAYSKATPNLYVATGFHKWGMSSSMAAAQILADLVQEKENLYAALFSPQRSMLRRQLLVNGVESASNLLRLKTPRCPHLGCALQWNKQERSWDCPCHGSRFDRHGKRLNGPATDDLKR